MSQLYQTHFHSKCSLNFFFFYFFQSKLISFLIWLLPVRREIFDDTSTKALECRSPEVAVMRQEITNSWVDAASNACMSLMLRTNVKRSLCFEAFLCHNAVPCCFPLQIHPFQRKALQMSRVRKGILSVQDIGCPQNITHAGQGTEAGQDEVIHCSSRERDREHWKNNKTKDKSQRYFFPFLISVIGGAALCVIIPQEKKCSSNWFSLQIIQK